MTLPPWLSPLAVLILGREPRLRRHVVFVLLTLQLYAVCLGVIWHSQYLDIIPPGLAQMLSWASIAIFGSMYLAVRSGRTQHLADPVLTLPHAVISVGLCVVAYTQIGESRGNVMILIAQAIVVSMFRLKPAHVLALGLYTVSIFALAVGWLSWQDPQRYPWSQGLTHLIVGGATLLMLSLVAKWVSDIRMRIGSQAEELTQTLQTLQQMATQDMLTGLMNRRVMTDLLEAEMKLAQRHGQPLTVALIDLDHFKHINDTHGHHVGDEVLKTFARLSESRLREVDRMARWGGEEFLCLLPQVTAQDALSAIDRLRQAMADSVPLEQNRLRTTFSAGLAQARPDETLEQLVERADRALYEAKQQGRNRCRIHQDACGPSTAQPVSIVAEGST